jgi:hypothetical protein
LTPILVFANLGEHELRKPHRAAELGDGWHPVNLAPAELAALASRYREACEEADTRPGVVSMRLMPGRTNVDGRPPLTGTPDEQASDLRAYRDAGLEELVLWPARRTPTGLLETLRAFAADANSRTERWYRWFNEVPTVILFATVILVVVKPF